MRKGPGSANDKWNHPWSFVRNRYSIAVNQSHGGDCKTFEMMTST